MLTIELRSLSGQFHATPWDHQVNEGVIEWPPSPWRLLRALIATWHLKARDDVGETVLASLVEALAADLPRYDLPPMTEAHTRHYMPLYDGKTTKIFQAFARVDTAEPLVVCWPNLELDAPQRDALELLLDRLGFLGRAESWIEARIADSTRTGPFDCAPLGENHGEDEIVRFLAPIEPASFASWRQTLAAKVAHKNRKTLPPTLVDALCCDTSDLKKAGWSQPPGSRWVEYTRPPQIAAVAARSARRAHELPTVARFAVASAVPPRLTEALSQAEKVHTSLVSRSDAHPVFTGCDAGHSPLAGHEHAFVFPESYDTRGHITHFTLYAPMGFDDEARRALEGLRKLWGNKGHDLQLVLVGIGKPSDFAGTDTRAGACPLFASSHVWRSRTPFVPTRHVKRRKNGEPKLDERGLEIGGPEHDLRRLLTERGLEPVSVTAVADTELGKKTRWLEFRTQRKKGGGRRGAGHGYGFELTFDEPVAGPIAVGYGAHLGLGQFVPVER